MLLEFLLMDGLAAPGPNLVFTSALMFLIFFLNSEIMLSAMAC